MKTIIQNSKYLLMGIVIIAVLLRLYRINNPILDWHAFRQVDTASVTNEFFKNGVNLLEPKYHDVSNIQSGKDNPQGYRMVEFPIINGLIANTARLFNLNSIDLLSRLFAIIFSVGSLISLFYFVKQISGEKIALLSSLFFAIMPFSVYYSRVTLPEPFMLFFMLFSMMSFIYYLQSKKAYWFFFSSISLSLAILLKPFVIFFAPVYITIAFIFLKKDIFKTWLLYLYPLIILAPFFLWRDWIKNFPEGIPASDWLFDGENLRLTPAWFRWLFYERITKLILGFTGLIFVFANFIKVKHKDTIIYGSWWLGVLIYFVVISTGNVRHDYYQAIITPIIAITMARGSYLLYKIIKNKLNKNIALTIIIFISLSSVLISWTKVSGYFNVNHWEYYKAGKKANEILPLSARVIAPAMGDTMFLYQTNRMGWPIGFEIEEKIEKGATHYINTSFDDETNRLKKEYEIIFENKDMIVLDLTKKIK